jgi:hypothetical protein
LAPGANHRRRNVHALRFTIAANAGSDFFESATTRCWVAGDFDAQITFDLPQWTTNNGSDPGPGRRTRSSSASA